MMPVPVSEAGLVTTRRPVPALTPRQLQLLAHVASGAPYKAVAADLGIALTTVKRTLAEIRRACDVSTTLELFAVLGWIVVPPGLRADIEAYERLQGYAA